MPRQLTVKAVVCALDNLENLRESLGVLRNEPLDEIVVVNNGSQDGTREWLEGQANVTVVNHRNLGAGPGRNAGLDAAGKCDYFLMLDGGIRPLRGGTQQMLAYLERTPGADVVGVEIPDFETDYEKAWRRWPGRIEKTYRNTRLSHTAYCLARYRAFDGLRFCEDGPFGEPGWGVDDDEMAYQWNDAGVIVHVVTGVRPYRRASGSWRRLFQETEIWPNQYGSVYEKRLVWLQQKWPQYQPGVQWGEPWLTVVIRAGGVNDTARMIRRAHDVLRRRRFDSPWDAYWNPYSVVAWGNEAKWLEWAEPRRLRQHHGDTIILDEYGTGREIVRQSKRNKETWAGDFRIWTGECWRDAVRESALYFGLVEDMDELDTLIARYDEMWPRQAKNLPPTGGRQDIG